ncbi:putative Ig domain-containing protein [Fulvivirga sedimenti]|uniref:Ig domain-containing protein n=1 Tax=Fulvivirga sedimenti TaxID=2879465 RepID=A0A9X1HXX4_9BACT|nr:putative Ig domain-containing protein [Fulvivirga sedimenti]MCA6078762.1 putative Ig domain-containing protein [Fulvivirga sedimenti]
MTMVILLFTGITGSVMAQPGFSSSPVLSGQVDVNYSYPILVTDASDPVTVTFELIAGAPGLSLTIVDGDQAILEGVPTQAGTFPITIRATNALNESTDQDFDLVVAKGNATVVISNLNQTYTDQPLPVDITTVPDGLAVDITYDGDPATPRDAGSYLVLAVVNDANYEGSNSGSLTINQKNLQVGVQNESRPYNTANPAFTLNYLGFEGNDGPGDLDTPPMATTSATQLSDAGDYPITIGGGVDQNYSFSYTPGVLTVTTAIATVSINGLQFTYDGQPKVPVVTTTPPALATLVTYNGSASPPSNAGDYTVNAVINEINYTGSATAQMNIAQAAATVTLSNLQQNFDGTPKAATVTTNPSGLNFTITYNGSAALPTAIGNYTVNVSISEQNYTGTGSGTLIINGPPVSNGISNVVVNEDATNSVILLNAAFDDAEDPDASLVMTVRSNSNPGLFQSVSIDGSNRLILDYAADQFGSANITVRATDTGGLFTETSFTVTVNPQQDPPSFTSVPITGGVQGQLYVYNITVTDPDANETFTFNTALPSWLTFQNLGNGNARLQGTPSNADVGPNVVALEVTDKDGLKDTQFFTIQVGNSNDAPFFTSIPITSATEGVRYTYNITTSDPDNDVRQITGVTLPGWLELTDNGNGTAVLTGIPTNQDGGNNTVSIRVEDTFGAQANQNFTIVVDNTNNPPFFTSTPVTAVNEDATYSYTVRVDDPDVGDVLDIDVLAKPSWLNVNPNGAKSIILTGVPLNANVGTSSVVITVTDLEGVQANQNFSITVTNVNDQPVFTSTPVTAALQGAQYTYNITTSDVDAGDTRTIRATIRPAWLTLTDNGNGTARLTGIPGNGDFGVNSVRLVVEDAAGSTSVQNFDINVDNANDPPQFTSTPVTQATEDVVYQYSITTSDPDAGDTRSITSLALPSWLTLTDNGNGTAVLTGTPRNAQVGNHSVVLNVRDALGANTNQSFSITVINSNDAPVFTSSPVTSALQDVEYRYEVRTNDVDANDTWVLVAETLPSWLTFTNLGNGNALLSGTPRNVNLGANPVKLKVTDAAGSSTFQNFTITVDNTNDPPSFTSTPVTVVLEDNEYRYNVRATDPDAGDNLEMRALVIPAWLTFTDNGDGTGLLVGTPQNRHVGSTSIVLTVEDVQGLTATQNFSITVQNTNDAPVFSSSPVTGAIQNIQYSYSILTTDPDAGDQRVITAVSLPAWLSLNDLGNGTAVLSGTPTNANLGANPVSLRVTDLVGAATDQNFVINVDNINDPPSFTSSPITSVAEDDVYEYFISTSDPDAGDTRTIISLSLPAWLDLTDNGDGTAVLTGIPENAEVGNHTVVLNVRDGLGANANQGFSIEVTNTNDVPSITSQPVPVAVQNSTYTYNVVASDPDIGDAVNLQATTLPAWLSFTDNGNGTGRLTGTPGNGDLGIHNVTLLVRDLEGAASEQIFTINVDNANDSPVFTSSPVQNAHEDLLYEYFITTSDPDQGDIRTITALSIPDWLSLVDNGDGTGILSGTPDNSDVGNESIVLRVRDVLGLSDDQSFTITVQNTNDAPVFSSTPVTGAIQDVLYLYNILTQDPDVGDTRTIRLLEGPAWIQLIDNGNGSASLRGTPRNSDLGLNGIVIEVVDAAGAATTQIFQINVDNQNDPPVFSSTPVTSVNQDELYQYLVNTTDDDTNDTRVIEALTLPSWLIIEDNLDGTAILTGVPTNDEVGNHNVVLEVEDALGSKDTQNFTITVVNINDAPRFTSEPVTLAKVTQTYQYQVTAIDIDANESLTISAETLPGWLTLANGANGSATLSGTPPLAEVNKEIEIRLIVTDNGGLESEQQFTIRTEYPNLPPTIQAVNNITGIDEDADPIIIDLSGITAGRGESQALTVSANSDNATLFENIQVNYVSPANTGQLTLTPRPDAFGRARIEVRVTDNGNPNLNTTSINFMVEIAAVPDAPVFESAPVAKISLGEQYTYAIVTSDADPGDVLRITAPSRPNWLTLTDAGDGTATLTGTVPANATARNVTLRVRDQTGLQSEQIFTLQVNQRPVISDIAVDVDEDTEYTFSLADFLTGYTDVNGDPPAYIKIVSLPQQGTLQYQNSAVSIGQELVPVAGVLNGFVYQPNENYNGDDSFRWNTFDGEVEASAEALVNLTIHPVNDIPVVSNLESTPINYSQGQGEVFITQSVTVNDIDNNFISSATVMIETNYVEGEDILIFTNESTPEIQHNFDAQTGVLLLEGQASKSQYDVALKRVRYRNSVIGEIPFTSKRITILVNDGVDESAPVFRSLQITEVFPELDLVNAFTPNDDGVNDIWDIGNLSSYRNSNLTIFDGNGNEVFSCSGTDCSWDGKRGGVSLPAGPYYYVIKVNDGQQVHRGTVSILK